MRSLLLRLAAPPLLMALLFALPPAAAQTEDDVPAFRRDDPTGAPPAVPGEDDPEVMARGPVHEGYAMPADGVAKAGPVAPKAPPEPIVEVPPDEKPEGDGVVWMPGYWAWDEDKADFLWVSGFWRIAPPSRKWVPGYWTKAGDGYRWVSGLWAPEAAEELPYIEEPPALLEAGPSQPAPDEYHTYVPGIWMHRERWLWRPGFWLAPRPDWVYCPPRWCWTPRGYLFCNGFWDRPLGGRGLLCSPVYFGAARPRFFTPRYGIGVGGLLGNLFVRPGYGYAFGDFYGDRYSRRGYAPWAVAGPRVRDPLFSYYRQANRRDRDWASNLATAANRRNRDETLRPARTLVAQNRAKGDRIVDRIDRVRPEGVRFTKVTAAERTERVKVNERLAQSAVERRVLETRKTTSFKALPTRDLPTPRVVARDDRPARTGGTPGITGPRAEGPRPVNPKVEGTRPVTPKGDRPRVDTTPRPTTPKGDRPRVENPTPVRPTTPKVDAPKVARPTPPKVETPKKVERPTPPKVETPKVERPTPRPTPPKVDNPPTPRPTTPRPTPPKVDSPPPPRPTPPKVTTPPTPRPTAPRVEAPPTPPRVAPPTPAPRVAPPAPRPTPPPAPRPAPPAPRPAPPAPRPAAPAPRPAVAPRAAPPAPRPAPPRPTTPPRKGRNG